MRDKFTSMLINLDIFLWSEGCDNFGDASLGYQFHNLSTTHTSTSCMFTPHTCARGKAIGSVVVVVIIVVIVVVVDTKVAKSRDIGT